MPALSRRTFTLMLAAGPVALAIRPVPAAAGKAAVFTGLVSGVAVGGYDPVAYFKQGKPVKGSSKYTVKHKGATWRFSSAANRDAFKASPARYAPQFGGYCAWAVSQGYTAKGDPRHWKIVGGRLYLNYSAGVQQRWARDTSGNIAKGNANWPKVLQ
jgi:YHS domain-containing protein